MINSDRAEIAEIHPPADRSMAASPEGWDNLSPELAGGAALAAGAGAAAWAERSPTHAPETARPILEDWLCRYSPDRADRDRSAIELFFP
ncbi:MAG: hypothetical protein HC780_21580 [Leptolyngbyaceae cyanobacterium CSU_1_3]|nr:hypothetical protein [Leptolyngbyaceae cyanobacterium CSU_1_3]